ncbi:MAG: hypothetical protein RIR51_215 [Bacteroidota bacterium]|jgi:hypothetical protein
MKYFFSIFLIFFFFQINAQVFKPSSKKGEPIIDYIPDNKNLDRHVTQEQQDELLRIWREQDSKTTFSTKKSQTAANFVMTYDAGVPENIKAVFNKAAEIWSAVLQSEVPIRVKVFWKPLGTNILGSASAYEYRANFPGAPRVNTYYPIALAEKIFRNNLNGEDPDIIANFSSGYNNWYTGIDGNPGVTKIDLLSVVLHEFGHGLGFIGNVGVSNSLAGYNLPGAFDQLLADNNGVSLLDTTTKYKNGSAALYTAVTTPSGLFWRSPKILQSNANGAILYSPRTYDAGSSIYHMNSGSYPVGNPDALMVPFIGQGEITRQIGPLTIGGFYDMGWYGSSIIAEQETDYENVSKDFVSYATIHSDTVLMDNSLRFYYSLDNTSIINATEIVPVLQNDGRYKVMIPSDGMAHNIKYYWQMKEASGKIIATPSEAPRIGNTNYVNYYQTKIGPDTNPPIVEHLNSLKYFFNSQTSIDFPLVYTFDNIGIKEVAIEYQINEGTVKTQLANVVDQDSIAYLGTLNFTSGELNNGDVLNYKVRVTDKSSNANSTYLPETGSYNINIVGPKEERINYYTNFDVNNSREDFFLKGFTISQPQYFNDLGLHSAHPYQDGSEEPQPGTSSDFFTNNDAILLYPIVLLSDTSKIYFNQVALVETGDANASFYNSDGSINRDFFDYVIIQASKDNGKTWYDLREGWDASLETNWENSYSNRFDGDGNSLVSATKALIKPMEIVINQNGDFKVGDRLIFRFRLHADVGAWAWGWYVDDLRIQVPKNQDFSQTINSLVLANQEKRENLFDLYPNPAKSKINMLIYSDKNQNSEIKLIDMNGRVLISKNINLIKGINVESINLEQQSSGMYLIQGEIGGELRVRKLIIEK